MPCRNARGSATDCVDPSKFEYIGPAHPKSPLGPQIECLLPYGRVKELLQREGVGAHQPSFSEATVRWAVTVVARQLRASASRVPLPIVNPAAPPFEGRASAMESAFLLQRHCMLRCRPLPRLPSGEGLVYLPRARRFNAWALSVVRKVCTSSGACRSNARGAGCGHRHQERGSARACWSQPLLVWSLARGVQSCLGRGWRGGRS